jgi:hypothetical protein
MTSARRRPRAHSLAAGIHQRLDPVFLSATLDSGRVLEVPEIENPEFYSEFAEHGRSLPLAAANSDASLGEGSL